MNSSPSTKAALKIAKSKFPLSPIGENNGVTTIGRSTDNSLQIEDDSVSSHHATITQDANGACVLTDLGSTNGTSLNGIPVTAPVALQHRDTIVFGTVTARYVTHTALDPKAALQALKTFTYENTGGLLASALYVIVIVLLLYVRFALTAAGAPGGGGGGANGHGNGRGMGSQFTGVAFHSQAPSYKTAYTVHAIPSPTPKTEFTVPKQLLAADNQNESKATKEPKKNDPQTSKAAETIAAMTAAKGRTGEGTGYDGTGNGTGQGSGNGSGSGTGSGSGIGAGTGSGIGDGKGAANGLFGKGRITLLVDYSGSMDYACYPKELKWLLDRLNFTWRDGIDDGAIALNPKAGGALKTITVDDNLWYKAQLYKERTDIFIIISDFEICPEPKAEIRQKKIEAFKKAVEGRKVFVYTLFGDPEPELAEIVRESGGQVYHAYEIVPLTPKERKDIETRLPHLREKHPH